MTWAAAATLYRDEHLLVLLGQAAVGVESSAHSSRLSNMVRGFATLARREAPLLQAAAREALRKLPEFDAQVG